MTEAAVADPAVGNEDWLGIGRDDLAVPDAPQPVAVAAPVAAEPAKAAPVPASAVAPSAASVTEGEPVKAPAETDLVRALYETQAQTNRSMQTLIDENARLTRSIADQQALATAPKPEELEAISNAQREALLADPGKVLKERDDKLRESFKAEAAILARQQLADSLGYTSIPEMDLSIASANGVKRLTADVAQFPLMADAAFRAEMAKPENLAAVFKQYPKDSDAVAILKRPEAWALMYNRAALAKVVAEQSAASVVAKTSEEPLIPVSGAPATSVAARAVPVGIDADWAAVEGADTKVL